MDGLAKGYANRPVVFLEYPTDSQHATHRIDRFMAAWRQEKGAGESKAATPHSMVDSGRLISWGDQDFRTDYREMIEEELVRPPQAIISAVRDQPNPSSLLIKAQVTNISTATLQTAVDGATVHVALFEGNRALKAGTEVKASSRASFDEPLAPGETAYFEFPFNNLRGVNLSATQAVVMVDRMPQGEHGRWDMTQAAIAASGSLPAPPTALPSPTPGPTDTAIPTLTPTIEPTIAPTTEPEKPPRCNLYLPRVLRRG